VECRRALQRASDGKSRAALRAPRRKNLATTDGLHPGTETVRACAANLRWLKSAFHELTSIAGRVPATPADAGKMFARARDPYPTVGITRGAKALRKNQTLKRLLKSLSLERVTERLSIALRTRRDRAAFASDHFRAEPSGATPTVGARSPLWITAKRAAKMRPPASRKSNRVTP